jgi:5-methylthioadenosine/S-adenosylhomocysteine deaminase
VPEMLRKGINVALGADGAPCNNSLNIFQELRLAALLHKPGNGPKSMTAKEVLDMATLGGAKALGWQDKIGSIEVGKRADLVALDLGTPTNLVPVGQELSGEAIASSIVYSSSPSHVRYTWVDGKLLFKNGNVTTIPSKRLMTRVREAQKLIAKKSLKNAR